MNLYTGARGAGNMAMNEAREGLEARHELPYAYPVDVWAAGCVFIELMTTEVGTHDWLI